MEGVPRRGFHRILSRLENAMRLRYCGDALSDELRGVLMQLQLCAQAVDHARQVDEATKSLVANASSATHFGSPAATQALRELRELQRKVQAAFQLLTEPAKEQIAGRRSSRQTEPEVEREYERKVKVEEVDLSEETRLIDKTRSILTKQKRKTWLSDALETARSAVRVMAPPALPAGPPTDEDYTPEEQQIFQVFKLLRKALVKHVASHIDELTVFRKLVRRLAKKRPVFQVFFERCEVILADRLGRACKLSEDTKEEVEPASKPASASSKSKKRKLSESSGTTAAAPVGATPPNRVLDIRSKAQLCSTKANALCGVVSLSAFDICLKLLIEVVNALSPQFTGDDTALVSSTLLVLLDASAQIKAVDKRVDRLVCIESLLSVLVTSERLVWTSSRAKKEANHRLTECRELIDTLRRLATSIHTMSSSTKAKLPVEAPASKRKKKDKPAPTHKRFD